MSIIVKSYTFSAGATIIAAEHNSNFDTLYSDYNGNITNANISASAAIALSKISFTTALIMSSAITNWAKGADVASNAGAITLGSDGNFFDITGTAAITSITAKAAGTVVMLQTDSTASMVDGSNLKLAGNFQGAADSTIMLVSDGTNWFEISRSPAYTATVTNALSKSLISYSRTLYTTATSGTTAIPMDTSKPQDGEGNAGFSVTHTPSNASNLLRIDVVVNLAHSADTIQLMAPVFSDQDATADCLFCPTAWQQSNSGTMCVTGTHWMTAGTTSATVFAVRYGAATGSTTYINRIAGAANLDGSITSSITVTEYKA